MAAAPPRLCVASCAELCASPGSATDTFGESGLDEGALYAALRARGVPFDVRAWDDARVDWRAYTAVVVRTTWDYSESEGRATAFLRWVDGLVAAGVAVHNSAQVLAWSAHKRYLRALEAAGVRVIPTEWVPAGSDAEACDLAAVCARRGWRGAVMLKPCVSGGSRGCLRVDGTAVTRAQGSAFLRSMVTGGDHVAEVGAGGAAAAGGSSSDSGGGCDMMVQPFQHSVERHGELSVVTVAGRITHALVKTPRRGDFRTQEEHGGVPRGVPVTPQMRAAVDAALAAAVACVPLRAPSELLLARLDFLWADGEDGGEQGGAEAAAVAAAAAAAAASAQQQQQQQQPGVEAAAPLVLLELEALEPCMYFNCSGPPERDGATGALIAPAAAALAGAIAERLALAAAAAAAR